MSAKTNIAKLPEFCYHTLNTTGELIRIRSGEKGFYRLPQRLPERERYFIGKSFTHISMDELADLWNKEMGVTKAQRQAMNWGSMFGWEVGFADPDMYDKKGDMIPSN